MKGVLWKVAKRLSCIQDARCLKGKKKSELAGALQLESVETQMTYFFPLPNFIQSHLLNLYVIAGIDTDKHKYPIGSGRVTFNNPRSYMRAVAAAFIEIKTSKFTKKVRVT